MSTSANMSGATNRATRNSQKAAEGATVATAISPPHKDTPNKPVQSPNTPNTLDKGFLLPNNPSYQAQTSAGATSQMATMSDIMDGNFYNEAFQNLSVDEKFSLILSELFKMRQKLQSMERSASIMNQRVEAHDNIMQSADDKVSDKITDIDRQAEVNKNNIIDVYNSLHTEGERISTVEDALDTVARDLNILKGTAERQQKQIHGHQRKITSLTARSMDHNITISGILEQGRDENCKLLVMDFLRDQMLLRFDQKELKVAHRIGPFARDNTRLMVAKVNTRLKELILANTTILRDKRNNKGNSYFVNLQMPDAILAEKRALQYEVKKIKDFNEDKPKEQKIKFAVRNKQLYINDELQEQQVVVPQPLDLFVDRKEQEKMDEIDFTVSKPKSSGGSQFLALATNVHSAQQTQRAYRKVRQMYPSYDHIMLAYEITTPETLSGYQDDGEFAASIKIQAAIREAQRTNIAVFVVRNFGGIHLGPKRFADILSVSKQAI